MLTKPPGWLFMTAAVTATCVILYWASVPYWYDIEMTLFAIFVVGPLVIIWFIRIVVADLKGAPSLVERL
ncbi:uncharacterized protein HemY [Thermocatellispora tengchongensis]|uniref:Uncharacterized protein HemY n=1 Tax=Thermocatellispora tengchongensis TaxID=1073253 RepID=A0A840PHI6_9ACTN|nr:hypothetical protein [Thermocatellispora tengchongensis]MBB5138602.1 uncharacterized protein HemY [Thermocatellispora tengchongensis]